MVLMTEARRANSEHFHKPSVLFRSIWRRTLSLKKRKVDRNGNWDRKLDRDWGRDRARDWNKINTNDDATYSKF
ncbi:hypothetical protein EVAR_98830_1 [Eumeta japonica]|uniref:Uncharacterized protein n=1 Tax=Eumeta variegata TaxID=151549 RepID=A0A4C1YIK7_EUMVA|nr:hypothetical protein EVAR_98830_1 [Eumeta japonica]